MTWKQALQTFCELYAQSQLTNRWMIVGSVGSVLQHAEMTPNDLDLYVGDVESVKQLAALLQKYNLKSKSGRAYSDPEWYSSDEEPYFTQTFPSGFTWSKGKWRIHDCIVEVVHISNAAGIPDSDSGEGIWEGGRYIWEFTRYVEFGGRLVPVVPLEIQLESNLRRQRQERVDAIIRALVSNGYDKELLAKALSRENLERVSKRLK